MCHYRVEQLRCGHKRKTPLPPCSLHPDCTYEQAALLELTKDLSNARIALCLYIADRYSPEYEHLIARVRNDYAAYFGRGSGNGKNVMASLRNIEGYLEEEVEAVSRNVTERIRSPDLCTDKCWEGLMMLGREEQERGGSGSRR